VPRAALFALPPSSDAGRLDGDTAVVFDLYCDDATLAALASAPLMPPGASREAW